MGTDAGLLTNGTIVKGGSGTLVLASAQAVTSLSNIDLNAGAVQFQIPGVITGSGNVTVNMNGASTSLLLNGNNSAIINANNQLNTYALNVVLGQSMPIEILTTNNNGTGSAFTIGMNNLTFNPAPTGPLGQLVSQPQVLEITAGNTTNLQINGTTNLGNP